MPLKTVTMLRFIQLASVLALVAVSGCGTDSATECGILGNPCCLGATCGEGLTCTGERCDCPSSGCVDLASACSQPHQGAEARYVIDSMTIPLQGTNYDLNGDGKADNSLAAFYSSLGNQSASLQTTVAAAIQAGSDTVLIDAVAGDPTFQIDPCAGASLLAGLGVSSSGALGPKTFTVDHATPSTSYPGTIATATFSSNPVATSTASIDLPIQLPFGYSTMVPLTLVASHVSFQISAMGLSGQINGALKVKGGLLSAIAASYTAQMTKDPTSPIKMLFDVGNGSGGTCTNADGTNSAPNDGTVGACEVAGSSIFQRLIPDVQLFAADGSTFAPHSGPGSLPDSVSVGIGFTAVPASF